MLTRIRIEAAGPDPSSVRRDLYASIHRFIGAADVTDAAAFYSPWASDEHYEKLPPQEETGDLIGEPQAYKGRLVVGFPVNAEHSFHATADGLGVEQGWKRPQVLHVSVSGDTQSGTAFSPPPAPPGDG